MRDFCKISFEQFKNDVEDNVELYKSVKIPQRDSNATAGYDICLLNDITLKKRCLSKKGRDYRSRYILKIFNN